MRLEIPLTVLSLVLMGRTVIKEITGVEYGSECTMYNSGESRGYKLVYQLRSR